MATVALFTFVGRYIHADSADKFALFRGVGAAKWQMLCYDGRGSRGLPENVFATFAALTFGSMCIAESYEGVADTRVHRAQNPLPGAMACNKHVPLSRFYGECLGERTVYV